MLKAYIRPLSCQECPQVPSHLKRITKGTLTLAAGLVHIRHGENKVELRAPGEGLGID